MGYHARIKMCCILCKTNWVIGRKLCRNCYSKEYKKGTLCNFPTLSTNDVFETRINKTKTCWYWTGLCNDYGYGILIASGGKRLRAHRFSYEFFNKTKIPKGKIIMHTCDNPPCVNPKHLRIGTKAENNKDTSIKRRHNYGLKHWNGRLSEKEIKEILESTDTQASLSLRYGVNQSHISRIRSGKVRK